MVSARLFHCRLMSHLEGDNLKLGKDPIAYQTFIHLFISNSIDSGFSISFNELKSITMIIIFLKKLWICPRFGLWEHFLAGYNVLLTHPHHFRSLLISTSCFRLNFYFPCPNPKITHFSREPLFLSGRMAFWSQDQSARCAYYSWGVAARRPSQWTELEIYVCTHTHICIYFCLST